MNGFADSGLDESAFEDKQGLSALKTFDAFPKTKPDYTAATRGGGQWTLLILIACSLVTISEFYTWVIGSESHHFSVEKGVSHQMNLNMDMVVAMRCRDIHINVQDAAGDRILAADMLDKHETSWALWQEKKNANGEYQELHAEDSARLHKEEEDLHAGHVLGEVAKTGRKFPKSPKLRRSDKRDACRLFGTLEANKVQGDWHITARGHGYSEPGEHLDHSNFNFSHMITELSFGPHYPSLLNPLDKTISSTPENFYKFQYYLSLVPTVFTRNKDPLPALAPGLTSSIFADSSSSTVATNQYAVTSQSHTAEQRSVPGIFFKYDIEPILLIVQQNRRGFLAFLVRLVNVVSGVIVGGGWVYQLSGWAGEVWGRKRRSGHGEGMLHGRLDEKGRDL